MLSANRKIFRHERHSTPKVTSATHRLLLAGTAALVAASTNVPSAHALRNIQTAKLDDVIAKKEEDEFGTVSSVANNVDSSVVPMEAKGYLVALTKPKNTDETKTALPKDFPVASRKMPRLGVQDTGEVLPSLDDTQLDAQEDKNYLRQEYKKAQKYAEQVLLQDQPRILQEVGKGSCMGYKACNYSEPLCVKDDSCIGSWTCSNSSGIHVEPSACLGNMTCILSPGLIVGSKGCIGSMSCGYSPEACIGIRACMESMACSSSGGLKVSTDGCSGFRSCADSPGATIERQSCSSDLACRESPNITIEEYSCVDDRACSYSPGASIGKYACNCNKCCQKLWSNCSIPDFACNEEESACSFGKAGGCPEFN